MPEQIGAIYPTQVPSYSEAADIRKAFNLYHYGMAEPPATETEILPESIAGYVRDLTERVDNIQEGIASITILGELQNLNDVITTGLYQSTATPTTSYGYPVNVPGLLDVSTSGNYTYQTYISLATQNASQEIYFRTGTKVQTTYTWATWVSVSKSDHVHDTRYFTQSQINARINPSPTASKASVIDATGRITSLDTVSTTELGYLAGTTSSIQDQLNNRSLVNHTHTNYWLKTETAKVTVSQAAPTNPSVGDLWFW